MISDGWALGCRRLFLTAPSLGGTVRVPPAPEPAPVATQAFIVTRSFSYAFDDVEAGAQLVNVAMGQMLRVCFHDCQYQ